MSGQAATAMAGAGYAWVQHLGSAPKTAAVWVQGHWVSRPGGVWSQATGSITVGGGHCICRSLAKAHAIAHREPIAAGEITVLR